MSSITINEHIDNLRADFLRLAKSTQMAHARKARVFIRQNPGCADHSDFWRGLSARQVIAASCS